MAAALKALGHRRAAWEALTQAVLIEPRDVLAGAHKLSLEIELGQWRHRRSMRGWVQKAVREHRVGDEFPTALIDLGHALGVQRVCLEAAAAEWACVVSQVQESGMSYVKGHRPGNRRVLR